MSDKSRLKLYDMEEVSKHKTKKDLWVAIHGNVYKVDGYLADHPGGADILLDHAGKDATQAFEDIFHSKRARNILSTFLIGKIAKRGNPSKAQEMEVANERKLDKTLKKNKLLRLRILFAIFLVFAVVVIKYCSSYKYF